MVNTPNKMKCFITTAFMLLLAVATILHAAELAEINDKKITLIQRPCLGVPVIIEQGSAFTAQLELAPGDTLSRAWLTASFEPASEIPLEMSAVEPGSSTLTPPADAAPGLYDLHIATHGGAEDMQPHSVSITEKYKKDFYFTIIADIHFGDSRGHAFAPGKDFDVLRKNVIEAASAVEPEFILLVGDIVNEPATYRQDYEKAWSYFVDYCRAPIFFVPGNHDSYGRTQSDGKFLDGKEYWKAFIGPTHFFFDYGDIRFVGVDNYDWPQVFRKNIRLMSESESINTGNMQEEQFAWLEQTLEQAGDMHRIVFAHLQFEKMKGGLPFRDDKTIPGVPSGEIITLLRDQGVKHVFVGHDHHNEIKDIGGVLQVMTNTSGSVLYDETQRWGFNTIHVENGEVTDIEFTEVPF